MKNDDDEMLFPWIAAEINNFLTANDMEKKELINLGIGDVCHPLPSLIVDSLKSAVEKMGQATVGYGDEQGLIPLREKIAGTIYPETGFTSDEIFITEGIANTLSMLLKTLPAGSIVGVLSPTYPVYKTLLNLLKINIVEIDPKEISSQSLENKNLDAFIVCSPNNPTGIAFSKVELEFLVDFAKETDTLIIFDGAYESFIHDEKFPRSIYEIPGGSDVAIEMRSFSKSLGFSGLRLGYFSVSKDLKFKGESFLPHCKKLIAATTNGVSYPIQMAGITALSKEGLKEMNKLSSHYMAMTKRLKDHLVEQKKEVIGGAHAPYIFWNINGCSKKHFKELLNDHHIITIPGKGFGKDGYLRLSGFIEENTLQRALKALSF